MPTFTPTQGRYLSFMHAYRKAFGVAPAHAEIVMALDVTSPSVNNMLKMLEKKQLIARKPGVARAIELLLDPELIPPWEGRLPRSTTANVTASVKSDEEILRYQI